MERKKVKEIKTIGIIGAGKMGSNLFYFLLDFNFSIIWVCSENSDLKKLQHTLERKINRLFNTATISSDRYEFLQKNIHITRGIEHLAACDLIIEAVTEDKEIKQRLFKKIDTVVQQRCIFTTNSSSVNPSELVPSESREDKFAGLHFFYPAALKNIVELILTPCLSKEAETCLTDFLIEIKRDFITLSEDCSFILNRIFLDLQSEAYKFVSGKEFTVFQIDAIIKEHITPSGAFEFCDHVGNDIMLASVRNYNLNDKDIESCRPFTDALQDLVNRNRLGLKTGAGFFDYHESADPQPPPYPVSDKDTSRVKDYLSNVLSGSILKWSAQSRIPHERLVKAMNEYLGC